MLSNSSPYSGGYMRPSIVVFLDTLGFKESMTNACQAGTGDKFLRKLRATLHQADRYVRSPRRSWVVKRFTDNVVIGFPLFDDGESELGRMLLSAGAYQFSLAQQGFFVRGGIAAGDVYVGADTVFGSGLVEAHEWEHFHAREPRIVIAPTAMKLVHQHMLYYSDVDSTPHNYHLLVDVDGEIFINYLMVPLDGEEPSAAYFTALARHQRNVIQNLVAHRHNPSIWSKYAWVARYHNFVCNRFLVADQKYIIDPDVLQPQPVQMSAFYEKRSGALFRVDTGTEVAQFLPGTQVGPLHDGAGNASPTSCSPVGILTSY